MKIRELADYCIKIKIDCDKCENKGYCNTMQYRINHISPYGLVSIADEDIDLLSYEREQ